MGLRHDGGDAKTGAGLDLGTGLSVSDASTGLAVDVRVRTLLAHQARRVRRTGRGAVAQLQTDAVNAAGRDGTGGAVVGRTGDQRRRGAVGPRDDGGSGAGGVAAGTRLEGDLGYGLPVGRRFVGTPRVGVSASEYGRDYRVGYGLGVLETDSLRFELGVDAQRRESSMQGGAGNGFLGQATLGW